MTEGRAERGRWQSCDMPNADSAQHPASLAKEYSTGVSRLSQRASIEIGLTKRAPDGGQSPKRPHRGEALPFTSQAEPLIHPRLAKQGQTSQSRRRRAVLRAVQQAEPYLDQAAPAFDRVFASQPFPRLNRGQLRWRL
jgi:hypothetical protein